jgi:hypothetical protein
VTKEEVNLNSRVFISYSQSSEQHVDRVLKLAEELVQNGIDVKIDEWDLKPGQNLHKFMEEMVNNKEINKVLVICDKSYMDKANNREGGVGTETDIITPEVYGNSENVRFIPIIFEKNDDGEAYVPIYFKDRYHIDLCQDNNKYSEEFEKLIRSIIGKAEHTKPKLGKIPTYILEEDERGHTSAFARAVRYAFENGKKVTPKLKDYMDAFISNLDNFIVEKNSNTTMEKEKESFLKNLNEFITYRDEYLEIITKAISYNITELESIIHSFFEKVILCKIDKKKEYNTESIKFIIYELFLYTIAILLKNERFDILAEFLRREFVDPDNNDNQMKTFEKIILSCGRSIWNKKIKNLMESRIKENINRLELIDADIVLYLKNLIEEKVYEQPIYYYYPLTIDCIHHIFEFCYDKSLLFSRCISISYTNKVGVIFRNSMLEDLRKLNTTSTARQNPEIELIFKYINISNLGTKE